MKKCDQIKLQDNLKDGFAIINNGPYSKELEDINNISDIDEQKEAFRNIVNRIKEIDVETLIILAEISIFLFNKISMQKSLFLGPVSDIIISRGKRNLILNYKKSFIKVPYKDIINYKNGKKLYTIARKALGCQKEA